MIHNWSVSLIGIGAGLVKVDVTPLIRENCEKFESCSIGNNTILFHLNIQKCCYLK